MRLVLALEAQFPDTEFEVVRHPRVRRSTTCSSRSRAPRTGAVIVYTLVDTQLRDTMGELCRRDSLHCCDLLGQPIEEVAAVSGKARRWSPAATAARLALLQADGGDRVRGQVRRRPRRRPRGRGHRARRGIAYLEDAAVDVPGLPRLQGRERADRSRHRAAEGALGDRPDEGRRPHDRRRAPVGDPPGARPADAPLEELVLGARRDLRGTRAAAPCTGGSAAPSSTCPALDPGDAHACCASSSGADSTTNA